MLIVVVPPCFQSQRGTNQAHPTAQGEDKEPAGRPRRVSPARPEPAQVKRGLALALIVCAVVLFACLCLSFTLQVCVVVSFAC